MASRPHSSADVAAAAALARTDDQRPVESLRRRRAPLASPEAQLERLDAVDLPGPDGAPLSFAGRLAEAGVETLGRQRLEVLQLNLGKLCNMACRHCHVDAGPDRHDAMMGPEVVEACLAAVDRAAPQTVDLTGGAPELNPHFRELVEGLVARGVHVIDRCNLTVLLVPELADLPDWLAERGVEIVCSLPHYRPRNTDALRGQGTFGRSLETLGRLNKAGYGRGDPARLLTLMVNPAGAFLPGDQSSMEREWKAALGREHHRHFDRLIALTNMPLARFLDWLTQRGQLEAYLERLVGAFNPAAVPGLMCKNTLSVSWDGLLYDCDFNQMLALPILLDDQRPADIRRFDPEALARRPIQTARHCFGCTAGAGSSCGGATAE